MKNISIQRKLLAGFAAVVAIVIGMAGFAFVNAQSNNASFSEYRQTARTSNVSAIVTKAIMRMRFEVMKFRAGETENILPAIESAKEKGLLAVDRMMALNPDQDVTSLRNDLTTYAVKVLEAINLQEQRNTLVNEQLNPLGTEARRHVTTLMETAYRQNNPDTAFYAGRLQQHLMLARLYASDFLLTNDPKAQERAFKELAATLAEEEKLAAVLSDSESRALSEKIRTSILAFEKFFRETTKIIESRNAIYNADLDVIGPRVMAEAANISSTQVAQQDTIGPVLASEFEAQRWAVMIIGMLGTLLAMGLAFTLARNLTRPILALTHAMECLARKETQTEVPARERGDELGSMANTVEIFKNNMIEADNLREAQDAEQMTRHRRQEIIQSAIEEFEGTSEEVLSAVLTSATAMQGAASTLTSTADATMSETHTVSNAADDASQNVQTVASAAEQLSSSISEISQQVARSAQMSQIAVDNAEASRAQVAALSERAQDIGNVVNLISDIAEQTNLLALNATIEAARAGDAGRGFAVVASEVKNLAEQTAKATEQISTEISAVQDATNGSVESIHKIGTQISEMDEIASSISAAIEEQGSATQEIARNVQQAAFGTGNVSSGISSVRDAAQLNSSAANEVLDASEAMNKKAADMRQSIATFLEKIRAA